MRIDHIALYCSDLKKMRQFFEQYFQAQAGAMYHNPTTGFSSYFLTFTEGSTRLEIMTKPGVDRPSDTSGLGYAHLALAAGSRQSVDALTARLAAHGYATLSGPRITGDGYYESCVAGPEGILVEITE